MADGAGGAVRAATSAGERMRVAAPQLISEDRMTAARPMNRARFFRITRLGPPRFPPHSRTGAASAVAPVEATDYQSAPSDTPASLRAALRQEPGAVWANCLVEPHLGGFQ